MRTGLLLILVALPGCYYEGTQEEVMKKEFWAAIEDLDEARQADGDLVLVDFNATITQPGNVTHLATYTQVFRDGAYLSESRGMPQLPGLTVFCSPAKLLIAPQGIASQEARLAAAETINTAGTCRPLIDGDNASDNAKLQAVGIRLVTGMPELGDFRVTLRQVNDPFDGRGITINSVRHQGAHWIADIHKEVDGSFMDYEVTGSDGRILRMDGYASVGDMALIASISFTYGERTYAPDIRAGRIV